MGEAGGTEAGLGARIFGTDGVRGQAGTGWLSEDKVSILGRVTAEVMARRAPEAGRRVLLGHDGRRSGPKLEAALARGFAAEGFEAVSAGLIPTPGLALLTRLGDFGLAAMISASHNPAEDNGIKLFDGAGEKLSEELELALEAGLRAADEPVRQGPLPTQDPELELHYLTHLVEHVSTGLELDGWRVIVDCANGAASRVAPRVFGRLGAQVTALSAEPDGDNINRACGSTHPQALVAAVRDQRAAVGIALDGDGDRCILVDERGELVHGDGILTICGTQAAKAGRLPKSRIVATVMSNKGLHRALRSAGVSVDTVGVGDKHVVDRLRSEGLALGGEQSGHVVFGADNYHIGDGIYTALRVLRVMAETGQSLSSLAAPYQPFPQVLLNVRVARKPSLSELPSLNAAVARIEGELGEDGRVLLRYSGTEPLARVMVEGPDAGRIEEHARELAGLLEAELG